MDQGAGDIERRGERSRVRETRISMSPSREGASIDDVYIEQDDTAGTSRRALDTDIVEPEDIERTRAHMSSTIEQIQERLNPERVEDTAKEVTEDVKEAVLETVDHVIQEGRSTAEEFSEIARVAALETVDHTIEQFKALLPTVSEQAQQTIDHAILEAKSAVRELTGQAKDAARDATIGKVERMAQSTIQKAEQLAQTTGEKAEQLAQSTTESTKTVSSSLMTTIRQNPGPAALTGLGLGWLVMSGRGGGSKSQSSASSSGSEKTVKEMTHDTGIRFETPSAGTQGSDTEASSSDGGSLDKAKDTASAVTGQAKDTASAVTGQAKDTASAVTGQAKQTASTVSEQVAQISTRLRQTLKEKPLAVGMVAIAVGSATGMAVPVSQKETQAFGESRDKLMEKAQSSAQDLVEKVGKVATEAGTAVDREAKYQGLKSDD